MAQSRFQTYFGDSFHKRVSVQNLPSFCFLLFDCEGDVSASPFCLSKDTNYPVVKKGLALEDLLVVGNYFFLDLMSFTSSSISALSIPFMKMVMGNLGGSVSNILFSCSGVILIFICYVLG